MISVRRPPRARGTSQNLLARDSPNISSSNTTCISTTFPSWPSHAIARACWICSVAPPGDCAWLGTRRLSRHVPTKQHWCDVGYTCNSRPQAPLAGCGRGVLHAPGCGVAAVRHGARACRPGCPLVGATLSTCWGAQRWFCRWPAGRTETRRCSPGHAHTGTG